jgi:hypothetical protein
MNAPKSYKINKGVNKPLEFRGLKGPWIGRFCAAAAGLLCEYAVLHVAGMNDYGALLTTLGLAGFVVKKIYRWSSVYGVHGLMKKAARRRVPCALVSKSRRIFFC